MSSTERENSFGGTEGVTFRGRGGPASVGGHTGWGSKGCREPTFESSMQHAGSVPCRVQDAGARMLFDCQYPTIRRTFLISKP